MIVDGPLSAIPILPASPVFDAIAAWPFEDDFVARLLADDIPLRVTFGSGQIWAYLDPQRTVVGFGTLDVCLDCSQYTDGKPHAYTPLLAVHPAMQGRGYGRSILNHLIGESACKVTDIGDLHPALFLDAYERSVAAIGLYRRCGFVTLNGPAVDPANGETVVVMAKRVSR